MKKDIFKELITNKFEFSGRVSMDSRDLGTGDLFFAINTGNNYVNQAIEKGAFVVYDNKEIKVDKKENALLVKDTVSYMQELASKYRDYLEFPVIAITGSNGKTTTKDVMAHLIEGSYKTYGNHNNQIGLPFTILSCPLEAKALVLEIGMSAIGEIEILSKIARPDYSIIVNIGLSHIAFLKTRENIFKAKCEIIPYTKKKVIVNGEDEFLSTLESAVKVNISNAKLTDAGTEFEYKGRKYKINLYGVHNATNVALCIETLNQMGMSLSEDKLCDIKLTHMRFEILKVGSNIYINDAYNAAPKSMESSLRALNELFKDKDKYLVLADMLELGEDEAKYHKDMDKVLKDITYKKAYLYGKLMENLDIPSCMHTLNKEDIVRELEAVQNSVIFLKGSRGMKLEEIIGSDN